jgi:hypothetical protein
MSDDRLIGGHFAELLRQETISDAEGTVATNREVAFQRVDAIKQANITTTEHAHCINASMAICCRLPTRSIALLSNTLHPCEGDISSWTVFEDSAMLKTIPTSSFRSRLRMDWTLPRVSSASDLGARAIQEPNGLRDSKTTMIYTQDFNRGPYGIGSPIAPL